MAKKLAVLVSGTGSLLEAMVNAGLPIGLVLADRDCRGLTIARDAGIPAILLKRKYCKQPDGKFDRDEYSRKAAAILQQYSIDLVAMAGFMTVFAQPLLEVYAGRILNIHPALLPSFKGDHAVRDALAYGVKVTGTTIHIATLELDAGPIIAQRAVDVLPGDTEDTLHERIKVVERALYIETLQKMLAE